MTDVKSVEIFTDGSCLGNPGPGGWGAILRYEGVEREISGNKRHTTNNRMEMTAVIEALSALKQPCSVTVYSDSKYIVDNIRGVHIWKARGWKTTAKKPVKNQDLWGALDELCKTHSVTFTWVKGHAGHIYNERVDALANQAAQEASK